MTNGECFFHYCSSANYKDGAVLFCRKTQKEVLNMHRCPRGLWVKDKDGFPVNQELPDGSL